MDSTGIQRYSGEVEVLKAALAVMDGLVQM
jgi:hypothetical protein